MAVITPRTYIKLVRFDVTKEHQITFSDLNSQLQYFENLQGLELNASTYQRKDGKVRFPALIDDIINYNYLYYVNEQNGKTYFCYITDMEYINDELTDVTIKTDVFQTFQFDFIYKACFVEREHVNDDTFGKNVVPEGLESGSFIQNTIETFDNFNKTCYIVQVTKKMTAPYNEAYGTEIGGLIFVGDFIICYAYGNVMDVIQEYETNPDLGIDCVLNVYIIPYCLTPNYISLPNPPAVGTALMTDSTSVNTFFKSIQKPTSVNGYTPKNKKVLTKEFNYLLVSNNNGVTEVFNYEDFDGTTCNFMAYGLASYGGQIAIVPQNYGNVGGMFYDNNKIAGGKYPPSDYLKDNYRIWLQQNSVNLSLGIAGGIIETGVGLGRVVAGDVSGISNLGGGIGNLLGLMKEMYIKSKVPPTSAGNVNIADLNVAQKSNGFSFTQMCIKYDYAKIIDDFFSMYGYKVTALKVPNITGRLNWNYVKTNKAIVESANVPEVYLDEFKEMLNNGVTFWHNPQTFLDYSKSNTIV